MLTQSQINALLRYLGTSITTLSPLLLLAGLSPDKAHALVENLQLVVHGFGEIATGGFAVAAIVIPVIGGWLIKLGVSSANPVNQANAVAANPDALRELASKPAVVAAVADSPGVKTVIATPEMVRAAPSDNVKTSA